MDYFYLKLGKGNNEVRQSLIETTSPYASIYFDGFNEKDYSNGKGGAEPRRFWLSGTPKGREKVRMVVIHEGKLWLLKPAGEVVFGKPFKKFGKQLTRKRMPVQIVRECQLTSVPHILATIGCNQYHARGTFRQIHHWGNWKAIDYVAKEIDLTADHWNIQNHGPAQLLECLSATEMECLVGKLFEAFGCFVPAHRGGSLRDIDLFVHNRTEKPISLDGLCIPAGRRKSIQVKTWAGAAKGRPGFVDFFISLDRTGDNCFDAAWLLQHLQKPKCKYVNEWLKLSLDWLPNAYFEKFGIFPASENLSSAA